MRPSANSPCLVQNSRRNGMLAMSDYLTEVNMRSCSMLGNMGMAFTLESTYWRANTSLVVDNCTFVGNNNSKTNNRCAAGLLIWVPSFSAC